MLFNFISGPGDFHHLLRRGAMVRKQERQIMQTLLPHPGLHCGVSRASYSVSRDSSLTPEGGFSGWLSPANMLD